MFEDLELKIWENTTKYKKILKLQKERFQNIAINFNGTPSSVKDPRFAKGRDPAAELVSELRYDGKRDVDEALELAKKHGYSGVWSFRDLELFTQKGEGPIIDAAMYELAFVRYKRNRDNWRRKKNTDYPPQKLLKEIETYSQNDSRIIMNEYERLNSLWNIRNESVDFPNNIFIAEGYNGMIMIETPNQQKDWRVDSRFHINPLQIIGSSDFIIRAKDIMLGESRGVYIFAQRPDDLFVECVWPHQTHIKNIGRLARDLIKKIDNAKKTVSPVDSFHSIIDYHRSTYLKVDISKLNKRIY
jgi:hypothetical protein